MSEADKNDNMASNSASSKSDVSKDKSVPEDTLKEQHTASSSDSQKDAALDDVDKPAKDVGENEELQAQHMKSEFDNKKQKTEETGYNELGDVDFQETEGFEENLDKPLFSKLHIALMAVVGCLFVGTVAIAITLAVWLQDLPDYSDADAFNTIKPTEVYASDHTTLLARFQLENREPLDSIDKISRYAVEGTVATEDERFYDHGGVDLLGMGRARC